MANSVTIPQDIIDNIIEAVGDDRPLLKKCALVSSSFLLPSRKRLFSKISLRLRDDQTCQRLYQLLVENPVIQSFVRSIAIIGNMVLQSPSLIAILRLPFCCLESFSIDNGWQPSAWHYFSSELKDVLLTIMHSSTLKILHLEQIRAPITLFHGVHLTKLVLTSFWFHDFYDKESTLLTSEPSEVATSDTVIDQCVWSFLMPAHGGIEPVLLPFMCHLRVFEIHFSPSSATMSDLTILSSLMRSLRLSLTFPATLEYIEFNIVFEEYDNHFNCYQDLRNANVWSHLDSIITHPTGSQLQRVDINIQYNFRCDSDALEPDKTEVMQPVLDALPLLREKGILFVEAEML